MAHIAPVIVKQPHALGVVHVKRHPQLVAVVFLQCRAVIHVAPQRHLPALYHAHFLRHKQVQAFGFVHRLDVRPLRFFERPQFVRRHVAGAAGYIGYFRQAAVRAVVVVLHRLRRDAPELVKVRQQVGRQAQDIAQRGHAFERRLLLHQPPPGLVHRLARLLVHIRADIALQPLGRLHPHRLVQPLNHAARLRAVRQRVPHRNAQPSHQAGGLVAHQRVFIAAAVVHVKHRRNAARFNRMAHRRQYRIAALRQIHAPAHNLARRHVRHRRNLGAERLARIWVQHLRVKRMAVGGINVRRLQVLKVAHLVRLDGF